MLLGKANTTKLCSLQQTTKENYVKAKMRDIIFCFKIGVYFRVQESFILINESTKIFARAF